MSRPSGTGRRHGNRNLLRPLGALYGAVAAKRLRQNDRRRHSWCSASVTTMSVALGKTPTVKALAAVMRDLGELPVAQPRWLCAARPVKVDPGAACGFRCRRRAADAGGPAAGGDRARPGDGVALAKAQGASVILMDDGFRIQPSPAIASLIVIDSRRGVGNGRAIPAALRAPLQPQLARTDALIVVSGMAPRPGTVAAELAAQGKPVLSAPQAGRRIDRSCAAGACWAFAGIGDPVRFFDTLRSSGIELAGERLRRSPRVYKKRDRRSGQGKL